MVVTSPSYLLDNKYDLSADDSFKLTLHHMDLYRLPPHSNMSFLNIPEIYSDSICLIEWPQRLSSIDYPLEYIDLTLTIAEAERRRAVIEFIGERWKARQDLIQALFTTFTKANDKS